MKTKNLFVILDMLPHLEKKVSELKGVNHRIYLQKCQFIISKILLKKYWNEKAYKAKGAPLRIHANNTTMKEVPHAVVGTLCWYFGGSSKKVVNMLQTLVEWGFIFIHKEPERGKTARTYKIAPKYENSRISMRPFCTQSPAFMKRLISLEEEKQSHPLIQSVLKTYEKYIRINEEGLAFLLAKYGCSQLVAAIIEAYRGGFLHHNEEVKNKSFEVSIEPKDYALWSILLGWFYASICQKNGRLDHNLTQLKKCYRKYIAFDGLSLMETDISNSQPTFSVAVINEQLKQMQGDSYKQSADMEMYEQYCRDGVFYEMIAKAAGCEMSTEAERNAFKERYFGEVMYCPNNRWETPIQKAFAQLFPSADMAIRELKKKRHNNFAIKLQKLESDVIVHDVYKRLCEEGYVVLPFHDAIYCNCETVKEYAKELIKKIFRKKYGMNIRFKDDPLLIGHDL